MVYNAIKLC